MFNNVNFFQDARDDPLYPNGHHATTATGNLSTYCDASEAEADYWTAINNAKINSMRYNWSQTLPHRSKNNNSVLGGCVLEAVCLFPLWEYSQRYDKMKKNQTCSPQQYCIFFALLQALMLPTQVWSGLPVHFKVHRSSPNWQLFSYLQKCKSKVQTTFSLYFKDPTAFITLGLWTLTFLPGPSPATPFTPRRGPRPLRPTPRGLPAPTICNGDGEVPMPLTTWHGMTIIG